MRTVLAHKSTSVGAVLVLCVGVVMLVAGMAVAERNAGVGWAGVDGVWTGQFGTDQRDQGLGIAVDASGVYVTGNTSGALPGQTHAGGGDAFLRKYDKAGSVVWTRQFGTDTTDSGRGVAVDASGVYVVGSTDSIGAGPSHSEVFVRRYDLDGNEVWTRQFGTEGDDYGDGVAVDDSGVYLSGRVDRGDWIAFVRMYDKDGNVNWIDEFGSGSTSIGEGIAVNSSGVYVAGHTAGRLPGQPKPGGIDAFVRMYDKAGNVVWTDQFGTRLPDRAYGVAVDDSGVYVTGYLHYGLAFVRKYDSTSKSGHVVWTHEFASDSQSHSVAVDSSGVYVTGQVYGALPGQIGAGEYDVFVRKFVTGSCVGEATIEGTEDSETLVGTSGDDVIFGHGGDDTLIGGGGDDVLCGGDGADTLDGGPGGDILWGQAGADDLYGRGGNDLFYGGKGNDHLVGGADDDTLWGQGGRDVLRGWVGNDLLFGGSHADRLHGGDGNDLLNAGNGLRNFLWGGEGNDRIMGRGGDDMLWGGAGDDKLNGKTGTDTLDGGPDDDECTRGEIYESCEVIL